MITSIVFVSSDQLAIKLKHMLIDRAQISIQNYIISIQLLTLNNFSPEFDPLTFPLFIIAGLD